MKKKVICIYNIPTLQLSFPYLMHFGSTFSISFRVRLSNQPQKPSCPQPPTLSMHIGEHKKNYGERKIEEKIMKRNYRWNTKNFYALTGPEIYTLYKARAARFQLLSFVKNWDRLYSSVYCDWSQRSSSPPRIAFKPFPVPINFGSPSTFASECFEEVGPWKSNKDIEENERAKKIGIMCKKNLRNEGKASIFLRYVNQ